MKPAEYSALAAMEDRMWYFRALHRLIERELVRALNGKRAAVLDAGCGTGGLIRRLNARRPLWKWTGLDASALACEFARRRTGVEIIECSISAMPFEEASFDAVILSDVLYHLDDDLGGLSECLRVLRPGGIVIVNVPAYGWLWSYHDVAVEGRRRYSRTGILGKMKVAGFIAAQATHWNTLALPFLIIRRKVLAAPREGSDVRPYPALMEAIGLFFSAVERSWLAGFARLPFGSSILATARKLG